MNKYVFKHKLLKTAQIIFGVALIVAISGFVSYYTCDGHAVIGPDLDNLAAQRFAIRTQTMLYGLSLVGISLLLVASASIFPRRETK